MRPLLPLVLLLAAGCAATPAQPADPAAPIHLTVVATNDFHGWLDGHDDRAADGTVVPVGGVDRFAGYLRVLRAQGPVVLLDAGDMWQGTLASNLSEGAAVVEAYNALGYDAAAVGNHEFDFGPVGPAMVAPAGEDPLGALKARAAEARFPLLAANLYERQADRIPDWMERSTLIERGGVRIGIVGLATPDTPQVTIAANVRTVRFTDPVVAAIEEGRRLRKAGAEVLLLLAHMGGTCVDGGCEGELLEVVRRLPAGLYDGAIGGHTHRVVATVVNGVPIIESGALGKAFGTFDFTIDPVTRRVIPAATRMAAGIEICAAQVEGTERCDPQGGAAGRLVPARFRGEAVVADEAITRLVAPRLAAVAAERARPLGAVLPTTLRLDYDGESDVGNLVTDAMRAAIAEADLAITNSGGLRAELPEGEVTFGQVFETLPFDNRLSLLRVKGRELRQLIRAGFAGIHGGLQVSEGIRVVVDQGAPGACASEDLDGDGLVTPLDRDRVVEILVHGKRVDDEADYAVVTNDFLAGGGGGWDRVITRLPKGSVVQLEAEPIQRDAFVRWLEGRGPVALPARGRIELTGAAPACPPGR